MLEMVSFATFGRGHDIAQNAEGVGGDVRRLRVRTEDDVVLCRHGGKYIPCLCFSPPLRVLRVKPSPALAPTIIRAMFVLYEVLLYLVLIVALPYFLVAGMLRGKYLANFPERMGFYKTPPAAHDLWIHAVSVGETLAARPVVDEILRRVRRRRSSSRPPRSPDRRRRAGSFRARP